MTIEYFRKRLDLIILLTTIIGIFAVYVLEYYGVRPCKLCYYQRYCYFVLAAILAIRTFKGHNIYNYLILILAILVTNFISGFQSLFEYGLVPDIFQCDIDSSKLQNINDIMAIESPPSCRHADFKIFGLSLANFSLIYTLFLLGVYLIFGRKEQKK